MLREYIVDMFYYIRDKKKNQKELKNLNTDLDIERSKNTKLKDEIKELKTNEKIYNEQRDKYLETIKKLRKEIRILKKSINEL